MDDYYLWFYNDWQREQSGQPYVRSARGYGETRPWLNVPADTYQADIALLAWLLAETRWFTAATVKTMRDR